MDYNYKRWRVRQEGTLLEMKLKLQMVSVRVPRLKQIALISSLTVPKIVRTYQAGAK